MSTEHGAENDARHEGRLRRERSWAFYISCRCGWESARWMAGEAAWSNYARHVATTRVTPPGECNCDGDDGETGHDLLCPRLTTPGGGAS